MMLSGRFEGDTDRDLEGMFTYEEGGGGGRRGGMGWYTCNLHWLCSSQIA